MRCRTRERSEKETEWPCPETGRAILARMNRLAKSRRVPARFFLGSASFERRSDTLSTSQAMHRSAARSTRSPFVRRISAGRERFRIPNSASLKSGSRGRGGSSRKIAPCSFFYVAGRGCEMGVRALISSVSMISVVSLVASRYSLDFHAIFTKVNRLLPRRAPQPSLRLFNTLF